MSTGVAGVAPMAQRATSPSATVGRVRLNKVLAVSPGQVDAALALDQAEALSGWLNSVA